RADARANDSADESHRRALQEKLHGYMPAGSAERPSQPDLSRPLDDGHQSNVGDTNSAHEQRDTAEHQEQQAEVALHAVSRALWLARCGNLEPAWAVRPERYRSLLGDQLGGAYPCLRHNQLRTRQAEVPLRS